MIELLSAHGTREVSAMDIITVTFMLPITDTCQEIYAINSSTKINLFPICYHILILFEYLISYKNLLIFINYAI